MGQVGVEFEPKKELSKGPIPAVLHRTAGISLPIVTVLHKTAAIDLLGTSLFWSKLNTHLTHHTPLAHYSILNIILNPYTL